MMNKICRTCGFTDCPGATTGNCPRWPAREDTGKLDQYTAARLAHVAECARRLAAATNAPELRAAVDANHPGLSGLPITDHLDANGVRALALGQAQAYLGELLTLIDELVNETAARLPLAGA